jgi:hypothetical protein
VNIEIMKDQENWHPCHDSKSGDSIRKRIGKPCERYDDAPNDGTRYTAAEMKKDSNLAIVCVVKKVYERERRKTTTDVNLRPCPLAEYIVFPEGPKKRFRVSAETGKKGDTLSTFRWKLIPVDRGDVGNGKKIKSFSCTNQSGKDCI